MYSQQLANVTKSSGFRTPMLRGFYGELVKRESRDKERRRLAAEASRQKVFLQHLESRENHLKNAQIQLLTSRSELSEEQKCLTEGWKKLESEKGSLIERENALRNAAEEIIALRAAMVQELRGSQLELTREEESLMNRIHVHEDNMEKEKSQLAKEKERIEKNREHLQLQKMLLEKEKKEFIKDRLAFEEEKSQFQRNQEDFQKYERSLEEERSILIRTVEEKEEQRNQMERYSISMEEEAKRVMDQYNIMSRHLLQRQQTIEQYGYDLTVYRNSLVEEGEKLARIETDLEEQRLELCRERAALEMGTTMPDADNMDCIGEAKKNDEVECVGEVKKNDSVECTDGVKKKKERHAKITFSIEENPTEAREHVCQRKILKNENRTGEIDIWQCVRERGRLQDRNHRPYWNNSFKEKNGNRSLHTWNQQGDLRNILNRKNPKRYSRSNRLQK